MIILVVTALATLVALQRPELKERWIFSPGAIIARKEFYRMLSSALIHADWRHFLFNAFSFFCFARTIEFDYGAKTLWMIYVASIFGGSLLSLLVHRHHEYHALGASGGVSGVIFASIFLLPGGTISFFMLPVGIPAWLYAVLFLVGSFLAQRKQTDNVGHDAHLGGAIVGLLVATAMYPQLIFAAPWMFAGVMVLSLLILWVLIFDPAHLLERHFNYTSYLPGSARAREYDANRARNEQKAEVDRLLEKVAAKGWHKLSKSEQKKLRQLSKQVYGRK
jgi:membrane associated rhomboid family serine protease